MAAAVSFYAGRGGAMVSLEGSGIGFYGSTFGSSVQVGQYQDGTWITSTDGAVQGPLANNLKKDASTSGVTWNGSTTTVLRDIPNASGTLNIRFMFDSAVKTQNAVLTAFDRTSKNNDPSGITCQAAELVHPWNGFSGSNWGSGSSTWTQIHGSGQTLAMTASPGSNGLRPSGADTTDTQHDWYVAISASPTSIGSKTQFGLYFELEYL